MSQAPNDEQASICAVRPTKVVWSLNMVTPNDIPTFRHEPLRNPRSYIRLLHVLIDNFRAIAGIEVHCRLTTRYFNPTQKSPFFFNTEREEFKPLYHAISYVWGSSDDTVPILVNGQRLWVGRNCEYALKQSVWYGGARYVWCDAICIDQTNDDEKGHQVYMMGDIYRNAQVVLACVGPHADGSPALFRALRTQAGTLDRIAALAPNDTCYSTRFQPFLTSLPSHSRPKWFKLARQWASEEDASMLELILAMRGFLDREYFSRTWIYQEIVLGKHIILCCGRTTARLYSLYGMFLAMEYLEHLNGKNVKKAWPLLRAGAFSWSSREKESLETLLSDVLPLNCSDPRDKVYAVLSLVNWRGKCSLYPDYTIDALSLASKVLAHEHWQTRHNPLDIVREQLPTTPDDLRWSDTARGLVRALSLTSKVLTDERWQTLPNRLDVAWEQLPIISDNLRLSDPAHGLARALYSRQFCPRLLNSGDWPYLGLGGEQRRVRYSVRFLGFQLDKRIDTWSLRDDPLGPESPEIHQCQFNDRENLGNEMVSKGVFEADFAILLPEVANPGDWCLLPYCDTTDQVKNDPSSLILIARRENDAKDYEIIGKGLGWREHLMRQFDTIRHDFWVRFGSEDLLVLFNQGVFSLCDFIERPAEGGTKLRFEEMKDYMRTGVCGRPHSSIAWAQ